MQLSNELAQKRYERLRYEHEKEPKAIEVANLKELSKEVKRVLEENMNKGDEMCILAQYLLDDDKKVGIFSIKDVAKCTCDDLTTYFEKLISAVRIKGVGLNFKADEKTAGFIIVHNCM